MALWMSAASLLSSVADPRIRACSECVFYGVGGRWGWHALTDIHQGCEAPERMSRMETVAKKKPRPRRSFTPTTLRLARSITAAR